MNNIKLTNIKAVIFDLDGTLIDTEKIYSVIWPRTMADLGYEMKREHYLGLRSLGRPFAPKQMKEWFGEDFDYDDARRRRKVYFDDWVKEHGIEKKPGAIELLTFLREQNIVTAIATATDIDRATTYLKMTGLDGYFDQVISATMVKEGKPSPDVYLYACEILGFDPSECIAVEDAPNGITSAFRAGCHVIMIPDQSQPDENVEKMLDACFERLDDIYTKLYTDNTVS